MTFIKTQTGMDIPLAEIRDFLQARRSGQCKCLKGARLTDLNLVKVSKGIMTVIVIFATASIQLI